MIIHIISNVDELIEKAMYEAWWIGVYDGAVDQKMTTEELGFLDLD